MFTITTYPWGTVQRTRVEDKQAIWEHAIDLVMDRIDSMTATEWDDVPTYEPMSSISNKPYWARTH